MIQISLEETVKVQNAIEEAFKEINVGECKLDPLIAYVFALRECQEFIKQYPSVGEIYIRSVISTHIKKYIDKITPDRT